MVTQEETSGHNDAHAGGEASEVERVYDRECFVQSGQSTASESAGESLPSTSGPSEGTTTEDMHTESSESLEESLHVPVTTQLSDHDSSESSDDSGDFTNVDAHHIYKEWLQQHQQTKRANDGSHVFGRTAREFQHKNTWCCKGGWASPWTQ